MRTKMITNQLSKLLLLICCSFVFAPSAFPQDQSGLGVARRISPTICGFDEITGFGFTTIASNSQARTILNEVMNAAGVIPEKIVIKAAKVGNVWACEQGGTRYILYEPAWINELIRSVGTDWTARSLLAHEVGHHRKAHLILSEGARGCAPALEEEADEIAGEVLAQMGASLAEAQAAFRVVAEEKGDECYKSRAERLAAVERGWKRKWADGRNPERAFEYYKAGVAFDLSGDKDRAFTSYNRAIELDPNYTLSYVFRSSIYFHRKDYVRAIIDLSTAIELDPKLANAYYQRGEIYYARLVVGGQHDSTDHDRAIADLIKAVELDPQYVDVAKSRLVYSYNARGLVYSKRGEYDHAIADYRRALELVPYKDSLFAIYINRGNAYFARGDYDHAIADYNKGIELDPNHAAAYVGRAYVYLKKGDRILALRDAEAAIRLDPNNESAKDVRRRAGQQ